VADVHPNLEYRYGTTRIKVAKLELKSGLAALSTRTSNCPILCLSGVGKTFTWCV